MRRTTRDYCQRHNHPNWRLWRAAYDMTNLSWSWQGNFCTECGERVMSTKGSGSPEDAAYRRYKFFGGVGDFLNFQSWVRRQADERHAITQFSYRRQPSVGRAEHHVKPLWL